jgi:hypothetical protein
MPNKSKADEADVLDTMTTSLAELMEEKDAITRRVGTAD